MAIPGKDHLNPGSKMAITLDLAKNMETIHQDTVKAVTVVDIMEMEKAPAYIIKTDIQRYDCKVIYFFVEKASLEVLMSYKNLCSA